MVPRKRPRRARDDGERKLAQVRWGLIPFWARNEKIVAKLVMRARYIIFQLAAVAVPSDLFQEILLLIAQLRAPPAPA